MRISPRARIVFYSQIASSGCWEWTGYRDKDNYGTLQVAGRKAPAHRVSYEVFRGPIPAGLVIDHLCRNRGCVNPEHLEPVTNEENVNRGLRSGSKTHCVNGHEFTPQNTHVLKASGRRQCRACNRLAAARYKARRAGVAS